MAIFRQSDVPMFNGSVTRINNDKAITQEGIYYNDSIIKMNGYLFFYDVVSNNEIRLWLLSPNVAYALSLEGTLTRTE